MKKTRFRKFEPGLFLLFSRFQPSWALIRNALKEVFYFREKAVGLRVMRGVL